MNQSQRLLDPPVTFDGQTFHRSGKEAFRALWSDVRRITGYKIDMFSWDEIRMDFELVGGRIVVVTEESAGFGDLMKEVERRFPSVVGWHAKVSQPPFAECRTVLHEVAL
jgi:hypothetical protein